MAFPAIALLAVGAVAVLAMSGKKGKGGFRLFDGQCRLIEKNVQTDEQFNALLQRVRGVVQRVYLNVTGIDPAPYVGQPDGDAQFLRQVLGETPGDPTDNADFCQATATEFIKLTATPACIKKTGIPLDFGTDTNRFGADWTKWEDNQPGRGLGMGDLAEGMREFIAAMQTLLVMTGYEIDGAPALAPGAKPDVPRDILRRFVL